MKEIKKENLKDNSSTELNEVLKKYKELVDCINHHNELYYTKGISEITDDEYDRLYLELEQLENSLPDNMILENTPTKKVGGKILDGLEKYTHRTPLLSIPIKTKSMEEIKKWYDAVGGDGTEILIQPKCDGITVNIGYKEGKMNVAATRGNGYIGENITESIKTLRGVRKDFSDEDLLDIDIRGEAIIDFHKFMNTMTDNYSNVRNCVPGILRTLDTSIPAKYQPDIIFYDLVQYESKKTFDTDEEMINYLKALGFKTNPYIKANNFEDIKKICSSKLNGLIKQIEGFNVLETSELPAYLCDGLVLKVNSLSKRKELGFTSKGPRYSLAYKFPSLQVKTTINKVQWQVGRTGVVTPKAEFDTVSIGGVNISNATLNNYDFMQKLLVVGRRCIPLNQNNPIEQDFTKPIEDIMYIKPNDALYDIENKDIENYLLVEFVGDDYFEAWTNDGKNKVKLQFEKNKYYYASMYYLTRLLNYSFDSVKNIIENLNDNHNQFKAQIENTYGIQYGDMITLERSNDVIPKIINIAYRQYFVKTQVSNTFKMPDICPVCGTLLTHEYPLIYCNNINCDARIKKSLIHYASRDAMNIVGLGDEIISLFVDKGFLKSVSDIYDLEQYKSEIIALDKFGEKKYTNLIQSINKSRVCELYQFIYALGIDEVGLSTSKALANKFKTVAGLLEGGKSIGKLKEIDDIGDITANHIYDFFTNPINIMTIQELLDAFYEIKEVSNIGDKFAGKTFVITGTLKEPRNYYKKIIESQGGKVAGSVSKKTNVVLIGEDAGSKQTKAEELVSKGADILLIYGNDNVEEYLNI